jgi:hypothetical protein
MSPKTTPKAPRSKAARTGWSAIAGVETASVDEVIGVSRGMFTERRRAANGSSLIASPCELAPVYVMLASLEASYISGWTIAVAGGKPIV